MPERSKSSKNQQAAKQGVVYVSIYKGEPLSKFSEQIQNCLQIEAFKQQSTVEIYGDIEDPKMSV